MAKKKATGKAPRKSVGTAAIPGLPKSSLTDFVDDDEILTSEYINAVNIYRGQDDIILEMGQKIPGPGGSLDKALIGRYVFSQRHAAEVSMKIILMLRDLIPDEMLKGLLDAPPPKLQTK